MANNIAELIVDSGAYINNWKKKEDWINLPDGTVTPAYLSLRRLISQVDTKMVLKDALGEKAKEEFGDVASSVIGLATAGIVWGDAVSERLGLPYGYVRSEKKKYGIGRLVEGNPPAGTAAILVDDTLHTGTSLLEAKMVLNEEKKITTVGALTIASLYAGGSDAFSEIIGVKTRSLVDYNQICQAAESAGVLTNSQHEEMIEYYKDPKGYKFK